MKIKMKKEKIPIHTIPQNNTIGVEVKRFVGIDSSKIHQNKPHRDDHYVFYFQEKGTSSVVIDFNTIVLNPSDIVCILPGQIHYGVSANNCNAWSISVDATLINELYLLFFEELLLQNNAKTLELNTASLLSKNFELLNEFISKTNSYNLSTQIIRGSIDSCIGLFATAYFYAEATTTSISRPITIVREFKKLLLNNYTTLKKPAEFASLLNISPSYLNECSKQITGFPVSYWIQQQITTEAKRLLYYKDDSIQEIAYTLGYDDTTYFSRLFAKAVGMSAIQFRKHSRE